MDAFIELKNVVKSYTMGDVTIYANNGVNFKVNKGEFTVIVGASGAGKTTMVKLLMRFYDLNGGRLILLSSVVVWLTHS